MTMPTPEQPHYTALPQATPHLWMVAVNEGWRSTVVCSGMYDWAAHWLVDQLQGKPYAPEADRG
jgi:hypothetical protein